MTNKVIIFRGGKSMNNFFSNEDYFSRLFPKENSQKETDASVTQDVISDDRQKEAYKQAADIRKFEIELFWKRGTYYWAFILAAFTAHFALIGMLFSGSKLSLKNMCELPGFSLFALAVTAFFCFFFSLAWTLVNKGSKFWQKNWEAHIDMLEEHITGNLYKTYLNTNSGNSELNKCPLCYKAYDYSVTKITTMTSIVLTIASAILFLFYTTLLFLKIRKEYIQFCDAFMWIEVPIILLIFTVLIIRWFLRNSIGNNFDENPDKTNRWYQRQNDVNTEKM